LPWLEWENLPGLDPFLVGVGQAGIAQEDVIGLVAVVALDFVVEQEPIVKLESVVVQEPIVG